VAETGLPYGTYSPNTNPDGSVDYSITYEAEPDVDLSTTERLHVVLVLKNGGL
jgi:hypothetical protein